MRKILITGGAGFIGSHIVEHLAATYPSARILVLDKMTYAADFRNISDLVLAGRVDLFVGDVCDYALCLRLAHGCDLVIHAAAESHVDHSFHTALLFTKTNVLGSHTLIEACHVARVPRVLHISTDEVYGEILSGAADETAQLNPTNPYSASKAAAEMILNGYIRSFKVPVILVRANNVFGTRQYPEKLIPRSCLSLIRGEKIPLHGDGTNTRHYLSAVDLARAIDIIARDGSLHQAYNVGSTEEYRNIDVAKMVCAAFRMNHDDHVVFVADRPFNDRRYSVSWEKLKTLGWAPQRSLRAEIGAIAEWYRANAGRFDELHRPAD